MSLNAAVSFQDEPHAGQAMFGYAPNGQGGVIWAAEPVLLHLCVGLTDSSIGAGEK
jgi:hypothetical protein